MRVERANIYLVTAGKLHPVIVELVTDEGIDRDRRGGDRLRDRRHGGGRDGQGSRRAHDRRPRSVAHRGAVVGDVRPLLLGEGRRRDRVRRHQRHREALWDIKGKALGAPVYELLGGRMRDKVRVYANGWYGAARTPGELAAAAERPLRDGYDALKCYPLAEWDGGGLAPRHASAGRPRLREPRLRQGQGAARRGRAEGRDHARSLSGGLTTDETIRLCRRFEELDITWIEEPADPFDVGALKKIAEHVAIPVAVGERIYTRHGFRKILEPHAADIVQPDVGNTGGIMEVKKIAAMAEAYNMRVAPHNCGSALSTAASLQIAACIPNFMTQEIYPYFPERPGYVQVLEDSPEERIRDGFVDLPSAPGLGVTLASKRLEPFLWAQITSA